MDSPHPTNRGGRGQLSGRGRGRGGRLRGGFNDRSNFDRMSPSVPSIQQVVPGASVSIVLKIDQQTGRQVQGSVAELLTRGNHPRGIKVRLQDGRVGRVQRMATGEEACAGSAGLSGLGRDGGSGGQVGEMGGIQTSTMGPPMSAFTGRKYGDYRLDAPDEPPASNLSLEDFIVTKGKKKNRRGKQTAKLEPDPGTADVDHVDRVENSLIIKSATTVCPVCGEFEGDEDAVAHHVNAHFD